MHLLFYGGTQIRLLHNQSVESVLKDLSIRVRLNMGSFDCTEVQCFLTVLARESVRLT